MSHNMKLLYGTTNPGKLNSMKSILKPIGIDVIGLNEMNKELPYIAEDGKEPVDNARQKSLAYYKTFGIPVFSFDSGLYFIDEPDLIQPGTYVRRYTGIDMDDDQLLEHYKEVAQSNGGTIKAQYINGLSLVIDENTIHEYQGEGISYKPFLLTNNSHKKFVPGFPLDSISVELESGKYFYDIEGSSSDDLKRIKALQSFFIENLGLAHK